jgi:hypothetical protein
MRHSARPIEADFWVKGGTDASILTAILRARATTSPGGTGPHCSPLGPGDEASWSESVAAHATFFRGTLPGRVGVGSRDRRDEERAALGAAPSIRLAFRSAPYGAPAQFSAPGLLGVPVSLAGSNVENFDAGTLRSSTGPELVIVRSPVDWIAPKRRLVRVVLAGRLARRVP